MIDFTHTHNVIIKSCKIGLASKFTFKVITTELFHQMNPHIWLVITTSCVHLTVLIPWYTIDNLHISHNASGMGANIRVLLIRNSSSHSSFDVNGLELPCLAATMRFTRLRNQW